jgi:hypothetical protein
MLQCSDCGETFPDDLVQPLNINGYYVSVCGVCALDVIKELHNIPSYQFTPGSVARDVYDRAFAYKYEKQEKATQG